MVAYIKPPPARVEPYNVFRELVPGLSDIRARWVGEHGEMAIPYLPARLGTTKNLMAKWSRAKQLAAERNEAAKDYPAEATEWVRACLDRCRSEGLRPDAGDVGSIYVLELRGGLLKVGRSVNPENRIRRHRSDAARFGGLVCNAWSTPPFPGYKPAERVALWALQSCLEAAQGGRETFRVFSSANQARTTIAQICSRVSNDWTVKLRLVD